MKKTEYPARARKAPPLHPGRVIGGILNDQHISIRGAAKAMGVSYNALANVVGGRSAITPDMSLRLGTYFGNGPELWLNMQQDHDLWHARRAMKAALAKIEPASAAA